MIRVIFSSSPRGTFIGHLLNIDSILEIHVPLRASAAFDATVVVDVAVDRDDDDAGKDDDELTRNAAAAAAAVAAAFNSDDVFH